MCDVLVIKLSVKQILYFDQHKFISIATYFYFHLHEHYVKQWEG